MEWLTAELVGPLGALVGALIAVRTLWLKLQTAETRLAELQTARLADARATTKSLLELYDRLSARETAVPPPPPPLPAPLSPPSPRSS